MIKYIVVKNTVKVGDDFLTKEKIVHDTNELADYLENSKSFKFTLQIARFKEDKQV